jgi:pimeloyl-ACP methyl ester carboxylesterase
MLKEFVIIAALAAIQTCTAARLMAAEVYPDLPAHIDSDRSYVIYSHGRIVEGNDPKPIHERWGIYDFPAIVSRLSEDSSFVLVAHHRSEDTDVPSYVERLKSWVRELVEAGVDPESITLVGFSRGGQITALAASQLKPMNINTVLLATCWETGVQDQPSITLSGRLLSIYETTDSALSCRDLATRSARLSSFEEVAISTGKEHGAFYTPLSDWVEPLLLWIKKDPGQHSGG